MYFDPRVKEKDADFFNFVELKEELRQVLDDKSVPMIAVTGLRRTGKTSLIRVVLNSSRKKYVWLDGRNISSRDDFYRGLLDGIRRHRRLGIGRLLVKGVELSLHFKEGFELMNKRRMILVIDEAQLLARLRLDGIVAYVYDNYPRIKIVLSGSERGMLMNFLGEGNSKAPLYGRAVQEVRTHRLEREGARSFLVDGMKQAKKPVKEGEIREAMDHLDGIIGWLTKYGWLRLKAAHRQALRQAVDEGSHVVKAEFLKFAARAEERYVAIIRAMKGGASWKEIKKEVAVSDKQLYQFLMRLVDHGFVEKRDQMYKVADPLLEAAMEQAAR